MNAEPRPSIAIWAVIGVSLLFLRALIALGARAVETVETGLAPWQWAVLLGSVVFFCYVEGYRALQRKFAPMVVSRALEISRTSTGWASTLTAPLYAFSLIGADRKRIIRAWVGVAAVIVAIILVRMLPFPWRGIVDAAVCAALLWGLVSMIVLLSRALAQPQP